MQAPLSRKQKDAVLRLRDLVSDIPHDEHEEDRYLTRWLRARNWDVKKAEKMLRNHYQWREDNKVDEILETYKPTEVFTKYEPGGFCGEDKEGHPLWFYPMGGLDVKGMLKSTTKKQCIERRIWQGEYLLNKILPEHRQKTGKEIYHGTVIMDMEHAGMKFMAKPGIELQSDISKMSEQNYPDTMRKMFIINAPSFFPMVFNMFKPLMHEETVKKIHILGTNYQETLLKYISPEELPVKYGGTKVDENGDPACKSHVVYGGRIPEKYYLQPTKRLTTATLIRGCTLQLDFKVNRAPQTLKWEFISDEHDIAFGVFHRKEVDQKHAKDMTAIVPTERCFSHLACESGSCVLRENGDYVFRFDNSYSWTRNKKVHYNVELLDDVEEDSYEDASNRGETLGAEGSDAGYSTSSAASRYDEELDPTAKRELEKSLDSFFRVDSVADEDFWYCPPQPAKSPVDALRDRRSSLFTRHSEPLLSINRSDSEESFHSACSNLSAT